MNTIVCPQCGNQIEIDKALEGQIEARVLAAEHAKHAAEIAKVKERAAALANDQLKQRLELEADKAKQQIDLEREKLKLEFESQGKRQLQQQESLIEQLRGDAKADKETALELRAQLKELMDTLREEKKARMDAELVAQKKLAESEDKIREDAQRVANESHRLKQLEMEKKLADTQKSLEDAQRKASQGSQQNQGEVLELDLENRLREEFPLDDITEVKKGQRGADIIQTVKNRSLAACGILLWETKNGKWQPAWVPKFKQDIREAGASIGVIVSHELPTDHGDMKHLENNVWVVKPALAPVLASALRGTILQVDTANRNAEGKDAKMEALYQFLTGPEFRHRVEAIVENYGTLQAEIEKEKRASALRWAHQEKAIRAVIDNTIGMYGDLQGITQKALPAIKSLEPTDED
jgi:hypothetical protein